MTPEELKIYNRINKRKSRLKPEIQEKERIYRNSPEGKESAKKRQKRHLDTAWWLSLLRQAKHRAKSKGLEFSITLDDLLPIPKYCPVLGIELKRTEGGGSALLGKTSPSIDRLDNSKGYIPGNVKIISMRANQIKRDMTFDEIEKLYLFMKEYVS